MIMNLTRYDDVRAFSERVDPFLVTHEAEHTLLLGLCTDLQRTGAYRQPPYLGCVGKDGAVVAVAMMTPPFPVALSCVNDLDALPLLAADVYDFSGGGARGVGGVAEASRAFAEAWQRHTGQGYHRFMAQRLYRLDQVKPVQGVAGECRPMTAADRDVVATWYASFNNESLEPISPDDARRFAERVLEADAAIRGMRLWWDEGEPVSMAGYAGATPHSRRIGAVYTPPERRKRGYASAVTAAVSQEVLDRGCQFCTLYTDLGNPTSNHIYQEIGYQPLADVDLYHFERES